MKNNFKPVVSALLAASMASTMVVSAAAASYSDTAGDPNAAAISRWSDYGVIEGNGDGTFRPNGTLTRAESAQILCNLLGVDTKTLNPSAFSGLTQFSDVKSTDWYYVAVMACAERGIFIGNGDGTFGPNDELTAEQEIATIVRALDLVEGKSSAVNSTVKASTWALPYVAALQDYGAIEAGSDLTKDISRSSAVALVDDTIDVFINKPGTYDMADFAKSSTVALNSADGQTIFASLDLSSVIAAKTNADTKNQAVISTTGSVVLQNSGDTRYDLTFAGTGDLTVDGAVGDVSIVTDSATLTATDNAQIGELSVVADKTNITLSANAVVSTVSGEGLATTTVADQGNHETVTTAVAAAVAAAANTSSSTSTSTSTTTSTTTSSSSSSSSSGGSSSSSSSSDDSNSKSAYTVAVTVTSTSTVTSTASATQTDSQTDTSAAAVDSTKTVKTQSKTTVTKDTTLYKALQDLYKALSDEDKELLAEMDAFAEAKNANSKYNETDWDAYVKEELLVEFSSNKLKTLGVTLGDLGKGTYTVTASGDNYKTVVTITLS